ncbi:MULTISPECIES: biotin/lipoyl-binding protein [Acidithrix]|uniref:Putative efflux pump membrane fusion protein n=1 Tax=Acidithrix ferrooxidans TaxID=1280514 RepID=A0A0D8HNP5_9ACTN|nr:MULTISPECIES: biotin/lipoyl-binding protein [Acidithrix]KJF18756.1 putative efflux pump membrane fusion protein [Acidithrix ferrooxidans]CAG4931677.1 unnamed protein product [Acidithrix sp. C25]
MDENSCHDVESKNTPDVGDIGLNRSNENDSFFWSFIEEHLDKPTLESKSAILRNNHSGDSKNNQSGESTQPSTDSFSQEGLMPMKSGPIEGVTNASAIAQVQDRPLSATRWSGSPVSPALMDVWAPLNDRLTAPDLRRNTRDRSRTIIATLLAILLCIALLVVVIKAIALTKHPVVAIAAPAKQVDLNFPTTANVTTIDVTPGQYVKQGQTLATQDSSSYNAKIASDNAAIAADKATIAQISSPTSQNSANQLLIQDVNAAQAAVSQNQATLQDTINTDNALIVADQSQYNVSLSLLSSDQKLYQTTCPNGLVEPAGYGSSQVSIPQNQIAYYQECLSLYQQTNKDQRNLSVAQSTLSSVNASSVAQVDQDKLNLAQANAALSKAKIKLGTPSNIGSSSQISAANAQLQKDLSQLQSDQRAKLLTAITAPISGIVEQVNGAVGQLAGASGTVNYTNGPNLPTGSSNTLFQSAASGSGSSPSATQLPFIVLSDRNNWKVQLLIPQNSLSKFHSGKKVTITFSGNPTKTFYGVISNASPIEVVQGGQILFEITAKEVGGMPKGIIQGMVGSATPN